MIGKFNKSMAEARVQPLKIGTPSVQNRVKQLHQVFDNMSLSHGTGLLLAGATGIGKTAFVKQLGKLMGMSVVLVEAPHVTEEHLINIPFMVFEPGKSARQSSATVDSTTYHVTLGKSYLATELFNKKPVTDQQLLATIGSADANIKKIWTSMGGTDTVIPAEIAELRSKYKVILFLDEYFRQTSANVRNILRGILNGRIGNDRIPPGVYVIYASNLSDVGATIEEIPLNADFKKINFRAPTKDEFFHYLVNKFAADTHLALRPEVVNAFYAALDDQHISFDDLETEIRTSPRRWEQLMLYVNSSVPVKSSAEAAALLANVRANFQDGEHVSSLHRLVDAAVRKILGDLHGDDVKDVQALDTSDWRDTLMHQIQTKIKLGDARTYVPVVSGQPGIGKTAQAVDVAQKLNMRLIHIDCSTLSVDEITGIPIPQGQGDKISVTFSEPPLYKKIMDDIKEADQHYLASATAQQKREYARQPYKYLIFFDEMNRVKSSNVFNSLRRVVLEKSFNDTTHLPKDSIIIAAINPHDKGTVELTGHLKDSIDVINTAPSWSGLQSYLAQRLQANDLARRHEQSKTVALDIVNAFAETFAQKKTTAAVGADSRKFHIRVGDDSVYISPREYSTMCLDLVAGVDRVVGQAVGMDADEYQTAIYEAAWSKLESTLEWIFDKHQVDSPQFMATVKNWLRQYSAKFLIKTRTSAQLEDMLDTVVSDTSQHLKDDVDFVNYVNNFDLNRFAEDFENYLGKLVKREKRAIDVLLANTHNKKVVENGKLSITKDMTSKLEYVINELRMAARAHNLSADLEDRMEQSVIATVGELSGDLSEQELTATLDKIHEIFSQK